jgi:hypothetical protein
MEILLLVFFSGDENACGLIATVNERAQFGGLFLRPVNPGQQSLKLFVGKGQSDSLREGS